jgi:23S rRNA pseudouridine1911/1915/1917 synthase
MKARVQEPVTLLECVLGMLGSASSTTARRMIKQGRMAVDGTAVMHPGTKLKKGQSVEILAASAPAPRRKTPVMKKLPFPVLYEDDAIIAVSKPPGLLTIATEKEKLRTLYRMVSDYVKAQDPDRKIFIVHRLDRDVSGCIVFAKDQKSKRALQDSWATASKQYLAAVLGKPSAKEGTVTTLLAENKAKRVYVCDKKQRGAEEAVTRYRIKGRREKFTVVEIEIETGRKHQIRVHMAHIGCPIVGDKMYGEPSLSFPSLKRGIALHAARLEVTHPVTGRRIVIKSPSPPWMKGK